MMTISMTDSKQRLAMYGYITRSTVVGFSIKTQQTKNMLFYLTLMFALVTATPTGLIRSATGKSYFVLKFLTFTQGPVQDRLPYNPFMLSKRDIEDFMIKRFDQGSSPKFAVY